MSVFYAFQDTATPVKMAIISIVFNLAAALALMGPMGHGGLALATSLASMVNLMLLTKSLGNRLNLPLGRGWLSFCAKAALCSTAMGAVVWWLTWMLGAGAETRFVVLLGDVTAMIVCGIVVYGAAFRLFFPGDLRAMTQFLGRDMGA